MQEQSSFEIRFTISAVALACLGVAACCAALCWLHTGEGEAEGEEDDEEGKQGAGLLANEAAGAAFIQAAGYAKL